MDLRPTRRQFSLGVAALCAAPLHALAVAADPKLKTFPSLGLYPAAIMGDFVVPDLPLLIPIAAHMAGADHFSGLPFVAAAISGELAKIAYPPRFNLMIDTLETPTWLGMQLALEAQFPFLAEFCARRAELWYASIGISPDHKGSFTLKEGVYSLHESGRDASHQAALEVFPPTVVVRRVDDWGYWLEQGRLTKLRRDSAREAARRQFALARAKPV